MTINGIDSALFQKLLNRCAARSVMEGATETYETVIAASELIRYIFDSRETVPLAEEIRIVDLYFSNFLNDSEAGINHRISPSGRTVYVPRLAVLAAILAEMKSDQGNTGVKEYFFLESDELKLAVHKNGSTANIAEIPQL
ncbi:MAG: hypothetical protein ACYC0V_21695 [Armatimonadota bacterium]